MRGTELDTAAPFEAELVDLAAEHRMAWLADLLPSGPCMLWAGGPSAAATIAADGSRTTLLLEPTERATEVALAHGAPGVIVQHAPTDVGGPTIARQGFASVVVMSREEDDLGTLLPCLLAHALARCAVVVVDRHGHADLAMEVLRGSGRDPSVVRQVLRSASCIEVDDQPVTIRPETATRPITDEAVFVVVGVTSEPSVLLGGDAGPARWLGDATAAIVSLRSFDEQIGTVDVRRIHELERALADAEHTSAELGRLATDRADQIEALLGSTSWRISAPARWASDVLAALRGGR